MLKRFIWFMLFLLFYCYSAYGDEKDQALKWKFRSFYMNRNYVTSQIQESLAVGGWFEYASPTWHSLRLGLAGYTSQGIFFTDPSKQGAGILGPQQQGYSVLGQAFIQADFGKSCLRFFRQPLDTPFINRKDFRMTPFLFEAYTFTNQNLKNSTLLFSYVTGIKGWTDTNFKSMTAHAGLSNTNEAVAAAGLTYHPSDDYKIQLWNYYCYEFMNVFYFQLDKSWTLENGLILSGSLQAIDQQDVGRAIAGKFHTGMGGILGRLNWQGLGLSMGYSSTDKGHDIFNPWGFYPGFTVLMEEDCDLAGERTLLLGLTYDFEKIGIKGWNTNINYTSSHLTDKGSLVEPRQREANVNVDYRFDGKLKDLRVRLRAAMVRSALDMQGINYNDLRVILNYDF